MNDTGDIKNGQAWPGRFWRVFAALSALGLVGVASVIPMASLQLEAMTEQLAGVPVWVALLAALVQSAILVAVAVAVGTLLSPKTGLTSLVADRIRRGTAIWPRLVPHLPLAIGLGLAVAAAILVLDRITLPLIGVVIDPPALSWLSQLLLGILYGGITEELLLRWGLMTALVWIGHRLFGRDRTRPGGALMWAAIVLTAIIFGIGHLPALATYTELTPLLVARTVALNTLGGIVFGWLYWRKSLEVAMVSHAVVHVGFAVFRPLIETLS